MKIPPKSRLPSVHTKHHYMQTLWHGNLPDRPSRIGASSSSSSVFSVVKPMVIHMLLGVLLTRIAVTGQQSID
jgi:hypothetical protein